MSSAISRTGCRRAKRAQGDGRGLGALIAIALVLCAVFVPTAFITACTGAVLPPVRGHHRGSTVISAILSLTLSPALAALLLRHKAMRNRQGLPRSAQRAAALANTFNRASTGFRAPMARSPPA
jgi:multidrug efflux pump subunit AcrB